MAEKTVQFTDSNSKIPLSSDATSVKDGDKSMAIRPAGKPIPRGPFPLDIPVLNQLKGKRIILASASPRRKQILHTVYFISSFPTDIWPY
jgi:hypothetical protein